jgi:putative drug exporter of the RND superfamily
MVFRLLGQIVRRGWPLFLALWITLLLLCRFVAPRWEKFAVDEEFAFLPVDAPSRVAEAVFAKAFPDDQNASTIVLVVHRAKAAPDLAKSDRDFIGLVLEPGLRKIADDEGGLASEPAPSDDSLFGEDNPPPEKPKKRSIIARIRTPNALGSGGLLVSPDGQAMLVVLELTTDFLATNNWPTITSVEDLVADLREQGKLPSGVDIDVTGSAVIGRDHNLAQAESARATELLTVVLVIGLLLVIYRAPLLAVIPLVTVYVAIQVSLGLLALLAQHGYIRLFPGIQIYITILAYGAGVDYCIFLTARCREELDRGSSPAAAVARAVEGVGGALVASAATVICGIAMMRFAEFGKFREAGLAIPLSLVMVLCATLTFSSSLLRLAGRWAYWPHRPSPAVGVHYKAGLLERIWDYVGHHLLHRPAVAWWITIACMAPFAIIAGVLYNHLSYDLIGDLPATAPSAVGTRALQQHFPAGIVGTTTVIVITPGVDYASPRGRTIVGAITDRLRADKQTLGLADIRSLTSPLGITKAADNPFAGSNIPEELRQKAAADAAVARYVTALGERARIGTRFELVLTQSPFLPKSIQGLDHLEKAIHDALPADLRGSAQLHAVGATASVRDLAGVMQTDRTRIELLVLASVLVVLILLLRGLVVPLYLLASVLFSYYATLGVSFAVFWLLDPQGFTGIDWKVAIFLFTILVAVGEDYNIFLLARVHEEQARHGPITGITAALTRTGPIISSCGIIMAGTFGSLMAGSLNEMKQLGFALAFGVLVDTFVVRPILVPAFLILLSSGRLSFWNSARKGAAAPANDTGQK